MKWYYLSEENEVIGPVSETALRELRACGDIKNETRVCREGTEDWITSVEIFDPVTPVATSEVFKFSCPHCSQHIAADVSHVGMESQCPACGVKMLVPKSHPRDLGGKGLSSHARPKVILFTVLGLTGLLAIAWLLQNSGFSPYSGKRVPKDKQEAAEWYRKAAEQGEAEAQFVMGEYYTKGEGVQQNDEQAAEWFRKAAEQGHASAQCMLGNQYQSGAGVPQNYKEAKKWYRMAADQGHTEAQRNLGLQYSIGLGVQNDDQEAVKWYHKAAIKGDIDSQVALGVKYRDGSRSVPQDAVESAKWYRRAAEQGHALAQFALGEHYAAEHFAAGNLVSRDDVEAAKWYRKAAEQGVTEAQVEMALRYEQGLGVPKDDVEATRWFEQIAKEASSPTIYKMGVRYARGDGTTQDLVKAYMWLNIADTNGASGADSYMERIAKEMTKDQIDEARNLSHQWMEKNAK